MLADPISGQRRKRRKEEEEEEVRTERNEKVARRFAQQLILKMPCEAGLSHCIDVSQNLDVEFHPLFFAAILISFPHLLLSPPPPPREITPQTFIHLPTFISVSQSRRDTSSRPFPTHPSPPVAARGRSRTAAAWAGRGAWRRSRACP